MKHQPDQNGFLARVVRDASRPFSYRQAVFRLLGHAAGPKLVARGSPPPGMIYRSTGYAQNSPGLSPSLGSEAALTSGLGKGPGALRPVASRSPVPGNRSAAEAWSTDQPRAGTEGEKGKAAEKPASCSSEPETAASAASLRSKLTADSGETLRLEVPQLQPLSGSSRSSPASHSALQHNPVPKKKPPGAKSSDWQAEAVLSGSRGCPANLAERQWLASSNLASWEAGIKQPVECVIPAPPGAETSAPRSQLSHKPSLSLGFEKEFFLPSPEGQQKTASHGAKTGHGGLYSEAAEQGQPLEREHWERILRRLQHKRKDPEAAPDTGDSPFPVEEPAPVREETVLLVQRAAASAPKPGLAFWERSHCTRFSLRLVR